MGRGEMSEAIVFLNDRVVVKEILYPEFEALLDHVVGIEEFKNTQVNAVYIQIDPYLKIMATVFFLIDFDASGYADRSWNIPLQHLVSQAGTGPDLGAGNIKLSCRSQCSISWHQRSLWDPEIDNDCNNTFQILKEAIEKNRLGLILAEDAKSSKEPDSLRLKANENEQVVLEVNRKSAELKAQRVLQEKNLRLIDEQKLRISSMKAKAQDHIEKIQSRYLREINQLNDSLEVTKQLFSQEKHKNLQLKKTIEDRAGDLQQQRQNFQKKIEGSHQIEQAQLIELEEKFELEARSRLDKAIAELKERLDMREVELFYRDEKIGQLNEEVTRLRKEKQSQLMNDGNQLLHQLVSSGVSLVTCQSGLEPLTIPLRDVSEFLESPLAYIASKCSVDEHNYKLWADHFELPVCQYSMSDGSCCAVAVEKIEKPAFFIKGESDRCDQHQDKSYAALEKLKPVHEEHS